MAQAVFPPAVDDAARGEILLQRPEMKKMLDMDKAMADVLSRTDIEGPERIKEYMRILNRFQTLRDDVLINGSDQQIGNEITNTDEIENEINSNSPQILEEEIDSHYQTPPRNPNTSLEEIDIYPNVTVIKDVPEVARQSLEQEPQTELAQKFLQAIKENEYIEQDDKGGYYLNLDQSDDETSNTEIQQQKNISNFMNSVVEFLTEGKPLNKKDIETFNEMEPVMKNAPLVYALIKAKIPRAKARPQRKRPTGKLSRHSDSGTSNEGDDESKRRGDDGLNQERSLFNRWDRTLRRHY
jgi:hypothetical protein